MGTMEMTTAESVCRVWSAEKDSLADRALPVSRPDHGEFGSHPRCARPSQIDESLAIYAVDARGNGAASRHFLHRCVDSAIGFALGDAGGSMLTEFRLTSTRSSTVSLHAARQELMRKPRSASAGYSSGYSRHGDREKQVYSRMSPRSGAVGQRFESSAARQRNHRESRPIQVAIEPDDPPVPTSATNRNVSDGVDRSPA